jgi:hypothetical protein
MGRRPRILLSVKVARQFDPELRGGVAAEHGRDHGFIDIRARQLVMTSD